MKLRRRALAWTTGRGAVAFLLLYFLVRCCVLAFLVPPGVPPDEVAHFGRAEVYAQSTLIPDDSPQTHHLGAFTGQPPLYYALMGVLLRSNATPLDDLVFLRLWNVILGLLTVLTAWRCARLITPDPMSRVLSLLLVSNTLMFTGLSASVSYDNLTNLLAALAIAQLLAFFTGRSGAHLLGFGLAVLAGCLTKLAFLPLAAILVAVLLYRERHALRNAPARCIAWLRAGRATRALAAAACAALLVANLSLYGGNLLRFGTIAPRADQVLGLEGALRNHIFARSWIVGQFRSGKLGFDDARNRARQIDHPGNRRMALRLLAQEHGRRQRGDEVERLGPLAYAASWSLLMVERSVGYVGHRRVMKTRLSLIPYQALLLFAAFVFARRVASRTDKGLYIPAFIGLAYAAVLIWFVNYPVYLRSGVLDIGLQGRYVFPVMAPLWCLAAHCYLTGLPAGLRPTAFALAGAVFLYGDLPWLLLAAPAGWLHGA
jgi:hypothetical protein